jgi:hypothetical protein
LFVENLISMSKTPSKKRRAGVIYKKSTEVRTKVASNANLPRYRMTQEAPLFDIFNLETDEENEEDDEKEEKEEEVVVQYEPQFLAPDKTPRSLNAVFAALKVPGHAVVQVFEDGAAGRGLRARNAIKKSTGVHDFICLYSYDLSDDIPPGDSTYSFRFGLDNSFIYTYVSDYEKGFQMGPLMNDPLDDELVNCGLRLIWLNNRRVSVVYAKVDILAGDSLYFNYGYDYWYDTLRNTIMSDDLRAHITERLQWIN